MKLAIQCIVNGCRHSANAAFQLRLHLLLLVTGLCVSASASGVRVSANSYGTQYYIDNSSPACSDTGAHSQTQPWCDFTTFNTTTFQPGDTIYLKSGDVWNQAVTLHGSGNATSGPITLTSYGNGAKPKIEYGGSVPGTSVVSGSNISYWTISGLEISDTSTVSLDTTAVKKTPWSTAIGLTYSGSRTYSNITISSNTLHGTGTAQNNSPLEIYSTHIASDGDSVDNITINDNILYNGGWCLACVWGETNGAITTQYTGGGYGNLLFYGNTAHSSALQGVMIAADLNGSMYDNLIHDTGLYTGSNQSGWGVGAFWIFGSRNTTVFNNEVYHSGNANIPYDAPGFDVDWDNSYITVYGNYLHDNTGAGVEVLSSDHTAVKYNRIYNNHQSTNMPAQVSLNDFAGGHSRGITNATIAGNIIVLSASGDVGFSTYGTKGYIWSGNSFEHNFESFVASTRAYNLETDGLGPLTSSDHNHFDDASGRVFSGTLNGANYSPQSTWCTATGFDCNSNFGSASGDWEAWTDFAPPGHTSNQWSYNYSTNGESSYTAGIWTESTQSWNGSESYCGIYSAIDSNLGTSMMSPGGSVCDAVLTWTAPSSGTVYIGSTQPITVMTGCGGTGVNLRILNGTTQIWPASGWQYIANGGSYSFPGVTTSVNAGDTLNFVVTHNGLNNYCDHVSWNPTIRL